MTYKNGNDTVYDYFMQHWGLFDVVLWISDHTAEDSQQSLCEGLQGLWPRGLVSVYTQTIQSHWHDSTWCKMCNRAGRAREHLQNSFVVCFMSQVPDGWSLPHKNTPKWSLETTGYCLKVNLLCFCHWQITRRSRNYNNKVNPTHLIYSGSMHIPNAAHPALQMTFSLLLRALTETLTLMFIGYLIML